MNIVEPVMRTCRRKHASSHALPFEPIAFGEIGHGIRDALARRRSMTTDNNVMRPLRAKHTGEHLVDVIAVLDLQHRCRRMIRTRSAKLAAVRGGQGGS